MRLSLSENIGALRRAAGMTQERLAEALGVSFAAVSKWERGAATPELGLIADMAELFDVSIDALTGFELSGGQSETVSRLKARVHDRRAARSRRRRRRSAAGRTALRSPITPRRTTTCAASARGTPAAAARAGALQPRLPPHRAEPRPGHQRDDAIPRYGRRPHLARPSPEKGIELLKAHNPCQLNDALIGKTLAARRG